ncbi:hypothetical protein M2284_000279 [Rhodococcus sp. LBL1]|nr:hypothetical protein [Rhodococcus sp. LBL1]MDH6681377.1 hypothetical protein [Rhodococcus sp. LBL2]
MPKNAFRIGSAAAVVSVAALVAPALAAASNGPLGSSISSGLFGSTVSGGPLGSSVSGSLGSSDSGSLGSSDSGSLGSSGSSGSSGAPGGFSCAELSTEATPNGWGIPFDDEKEQVARYTDDSVLDTDGALKLEVKDSTGRSVSYHEAGGIKLSDAIAKEIGFSERAEHPTASFQLRLTGTSSEHPKFENGFTTLVWVPDADATDTSNGGFHSNLQDGKWWSTSPIAGAENRGDLVPLADIAALNPDAVVDHYGVSLGTGSEATSTLVDSVKFNGCTTNFAKNDPKPASGSLGSLDVSGSLGSGSLGTGSLGSLDAGSRGTGSLDSASLGS